MTAAIIAAIAIVLAFAAGVILSKKIIARVDKAEATITFSLITARNSIGQDMTAIHNRIAALEKAVKGKK